MIHDTLHKFGYPDNLVRDYEHWAVLLRPKQITLGSLVLISKSKDTEFSALSAAAIQEMGIILKHIEGALSAFTNYQKINYLTLMMVDPHVHTHILPRYEGSQSFEGIEFPDTAWPGPPNITAARPCPDAVFSAILAKIKAHFDTYIDTHNNI